MFLKLTLLLLTAYVCITNTLPAFTYSLEDINYISPQETEWSPNFAKRPFPLSQVTFETNRNKRPFWRLQPIINSGEDDGDYYRIAAEKKSIKRPFPHSKVKFQQHPKKRPFWRLQPIMDTGEEEDDAWLDWLTVGSPNNLRFANAANKRAATMKKRPFILSKPKFNKRDANFEDVQ